MKAALEEIWNRPGLVSATHYVIWDAHRRRGVSEYVGPWLFATPGAEAAPAPGKSATAFRKRVTKHYGPPPDVCWTRRSLYVSTEYRARARERFPRNWRCVVDYCGVSSVDGAERDMLDGK